MAAQDEPPTPTETARVVAEVGERAAAGAGAAPAPAPQLSARARAALGETRRHLDTAWHSSDAGTDLPDAARLRSVKKAVLVGLRPVTSHQVPFNRDLVVAIDRLANVVEELAGTVQTVEERTDGTLKRVQAGIATVEVGAADLEADAADLAAQVADLAAHAEDLVRRIEGAEADLVELRQAGAATRSREDVVLRAARDAVTAAGAAPSTALALGLLADEAGRADAHLLRQLAAAGRPDAEVLRRQARVVADAVVAAAAAAPVLDLASDRGEWLDVWDEVGVEASGVEDDPDHVEALRGRGHRVVAEEPVAHVRSAPAGSAGAITAAVLADVVALPDLVDLVDTARAALRPGGVLVLGAAHPNGQGTDDPQWADPRRRPLHPRTLTLLVLERGYAEAEVVALGDPDEPGPATYAVVARTAGGPPAPV
ncbi:hypothetical protein [Iamia sp.]|uniref:hypothetical protein n=1 Tax=Iamia sp. TaxID=2722710 RepID=UPI002C601086|nr:hypothetical protein [Iamia sp.]HXH56412.1 hypothetical protein [Iamia sp.]